MNLAVQHLQQSGLPKESELWPIQNPDFIQNPFPWYESLRNLAPLYVMEDGSYLISNYEDTVKYLKHPLMSAVEPERIASKNPWDALFNTMLYSNPPLHTERRRHVNKWFTPKLVRDWVQTTAKITVAKLDALANGAVIDAYEEIAVESTHITICHLLELPEDEIYEVTRHWFHATLALRDYPEPWQIEAAEKGFRYLRDRVDALLSEKLKNPGQGLADELLGKYKAGEMSYDEVAETVLILYASGGHNPGFMIAAGLETFARQPELFKEYKNNPAIRKNFVNELIRMNPPELIMSRYPIEEIEIQGVKIPPESRVKFLLGGANFDPDFFENPYVFDVNRPPENSMNLSFGIGAHSCAGQVLSRAECETVFTIIAERYNAVELAEEPVTDHTERVRSYTNLKVRFIA